MFQMNLLPMASLVFAFRQSNLFGQAIVALLFFGSILVWSVMLTKAYELRVAVQDTLRFMSAFQREPRIAALFEQQRRFPRSPVFMVYETVCRRWRALTGDAPTAAARGAGVVDDAVALSAAELSVLRGETEKSLAVQELALDDNMGLLATAVTAAPFLGLLGTVWGVMEAFVGMAASGSALLSAVAPGISAALLTTVVGLLVALPSLIGHNLLVNRIRRSTIEMHNFAEALLADIERRHGSGAREARRPVFSSD